ncbi:uncharacterized protein LOC141605899 [Silene latifolia]|uniref:uncharacterized protein LOC141605899 n=1 Tax=Silene latifolia TaxID=37657 RepID=UPI003D776F9B
MSHSHVNRNQGSEISLIKQTVQYAFFLVVFLWLLYQIHHSIYVRRDSDCDFIENKLTNDGIDQVLSRKGGVKVEKTVYTEGVELYGVDLIGEALRLNNDTDGDDDQSDKRPDYDGNGVVKSSGDNSLMAESGNRSSENGVILNKAASVEMFRFSDENGVPEHESGAATRSDTGVETEIVQKGRVSKAGNQTEKIGAYHQNVDSQNETENERPKMLVLQKEV